MEDETVNSVFFQKFRADKKIGKGSFGTVYQGTNLHTGEKVAIKLESREEETNLLETEAYRMIYLKGDGIPKVYCYGNNRTHNVLVIELLGKSLEDLFQANQRKFSLKTVCVLGIEMIKRIQFIHDKNHIHRDIKPDNFMIGVENNEDVLYLIDFGLAKKYRSSSKKGQHIPFKDGKSITGTARYCSVNTHKGYEQSRRDDLESIGYVLMYFLRGVLPWQGLRSVGTEDPYVRIGRKKEDTTVADLCKGYPNEFIAYFSYVKGLSFEGDPKYEYLISLFENIVASFCMDCNYDFDWKKSLKNSTGKEVSECNTTICLKKTTSTSLHMSNNAGRSTLKLSASQINIDKSSLIYKNEFDVLSLTKQKDNVDNVQYDQDKHGNGNGCNGGDKNFKKTDNKNLPNKKEEINIIKGKKSEEIQHHNNNNNNNNNNTPGNGIATKNNTTPVYSKNAQVIMQTSKVNQVGNKIKNEKEKEKSNGFACKCAIF